MYANTLNERNGVQDTYHKQADWRVQGWGCCPRESSLPARQTLHPCLGLSWNTGHPLTDEQAPNNFHWKK